MMDLKREALKEDTYILINPAGRFAISGPAGDSRLTGRKIVVDTYGGGAFSGKDPTKTVQVQDPDGDFRSAAYAAGYVAKNIVAAGADAKRRHLRRIFFRHGIGCGQEVCACSQQ